MKTVIALLLGAGIAASAAAPVEAAQPPRVKAVACNALKASASWWTVFYGEREGFFVKREWYRAVPCFRTQAACKAWLYWAQSDWPNMTQVQPCRKGKPY